MTISIGRYSFMGPFSTIHDLEDKEGIYAIACNYNDKLVLIRIGESGNVKNTLKYDDRKQSWQKYCNGKIEYWVDYTPNLQQNERQLIVREILREYRNVCRGSP
jgi:hypothetical protein